MSLLFYRERKLYALSVLHLYLAILIFVAAQDNWVTYCGRSTYGSPSVEECRVLQTSFANHEDTGIRVFDEEQQRISKDGSWPGMEDIVGAAHLDLVVQLPKVYTNGTYILYRPAPTPDVMKSAIDADFEQQESCNFALISYAGGIDDYSPFGATSWAKINGGGNTTITRCLLDEGIASGGVAVIPSGELPAHTCVISGRDH